MDHVLFIAASYGVSLLGLGLLTAWTLLSYRHEQRALAELEARGLRRRARPAAKAEPQGAAQSDPLVGTK
ncbi:heme exporter protein CcmD [Xanthobacter sediminis]